MDSSKSPFDDPDLHRKSESSTGDASSATAIFGTAPAKPAQLQEDDILKSLLGNPSASSTAPAETPWTPATSPDEPQPPALSGSPGEFTDRFQALQNPAQFTPTPPAPAAAPAPATPPPAPSPQPPTDLSSVFTQVVVEKTTFSPPPSPKAGEFTQLLQTLSASTQNPKTQAAPSVASPATPPAPPAVPPAAPGVFTQLFGSVSAPAGPGPSDESHPTAAVPMYSPPAHEPEPQPPRPAPSTPGDFTQMFQSLTGANETASPLASPPAPPPLATPQAPSSPGAFTQFFASPSPGSTPAEDPLKSLRPESTVAPSPGTFSFQTPPQTPPSRPPEPSPIAQGGFTQLMNALNQDAVKHEEAPANAPEPFMPPPQPAPASPSAGIGGFTQLLNTLSAEPAPRPAQPASMPTAAPPVPGPVSGAAGEFTRVISGDQLRGLQGQNIAPGPTVLPQPSAAPRPPLKFPSAPPFPAAAPPTPPVPATHAPAAAPPAMPHFQPSGFQFPPAPAPPAPPPAPSKLQQYLPLILVLNIFVLLVIVVILIFLLRHH